MAGPLLHTTLALQAQPDQISTAVALGLVVGALAIMAILARLRLHPIAPRRASEYEQPLLQVGRWLAATPSDEQAVARTGHRAAARLLSPSRFVLARLKDGRLHPLPDPDSRQPLDREAILRSYQVSAELVHAQGPLWRRDSRGRRALISPIRFQSRAQGVFLAELDSNALEPKTAEHLATRLAAWLGPVLERLSFREEAEARGGKLALLSEISRRLISLRPLEERWSNAVPLISQVFGSAQAWIYEIQQDRAAPIAGSHSGEGSPDPDHPLIAAAVADRATVQSDAHSTASDKTILVVPLTVEEHLLGVLTLARAPDKRFTDEEVALAEMLAGQLAIAALEAHNFSQQQEYTWYNTVMLEVTRHAAQPGDPEAALRAVLQLTTMLAGAKWALLLLHEAPSDRLQLGPSSGINRGALDRLQQIQLTPATFGLEAPYSESEAPFSVELPDALADVLDDKRALALALSDGQDLLGLLLVSGASPVGPRQALIAGIGHQISLRIENSRLVEEVAGRRALERELETARNIQESFLPDKLPEADGWELGATWLAARQVGGDFFDFIRLPEGDRGPRWGVVIADVADKGVPAALFMALCRTLVRSVAITVADPGEVLARSNDLILADTRADLFVSLFYGLWEPGNPSFRYASAGHNPPIVHHPDNSMMLLKEHGMVLGVSPKAKYETQQVDLAPGSTIVLYTDGVTEAMDESGAFFGLDRLSELVRAEMGTSAQALAQRINHAVRDFCLTDDPPDDLTTVVLRRTRNA